MSTPDESPATPTDALAAAAEARNRSDERDMIKVWQEHGLLAAGYLTAVHAYRTAVEYHDAELVAPALETMRIHSTRLRNALDLMHGPTEADSVLATYLVLVPVDQVEDLDGRTVYLVSKDPEGRPRITDCTCTPTSDADPKLLCDRCQLHDVYRAVAIEQTIPTLRPGTPIVHQSSPSSATVEAATSAGLEANVGDTADTPPTVLPGDVSAGPQSSAPGYADTAETPQPTEPSPAESAGGRVDDPQSSTLPQPTTTEEI